MFLIRGIRPKQGFGIQQPIGRKTLLVSSQKKCFASPIVFPQQQREMAFFDSFFGKKNKNEFKPQSPIKTETEKDSSSPLAVETNENSEEEKLTIPSESTLRRPFDLSQSNQNPEHFRPFSPQHENSLKMLEGHKVLSQRVRDWKDSFEKNGTPDIKAVEDVIEFFARNRNQNQLMNYIKTAREQEVKFTENMYTVIIQHFYNRQNYVSAEAWLKDMSEEGYKPGTVLMNGLMKTYKRCHMFGKMRELLKKMKEDQVADAMSHNLNLKVLVAQGRTDKWKSFLKEIEETGLPLQEQTYEPILHFYGKHRETKSLLDMFQRMKDHGVKPTDRTYDIAMRRVIWTHQNDLIYEWLKKMDEDQVVPSNKIYRDLIWHAVNMGDKHQTVKFVEWMDERGVKRDSVIDGRLRKMKLLWKGQIDFKYINE
eukprot:TRINITY_DN2427_c0_g1_i1.p1 TRINITY_DN2427_c0_g1~~TRINITY_DN2427_c0_g1_i1.p1  ORF type:complete len:424 (+),score=155.29 TRINITY_DN2427_c0_g1_i1:225-1496(+)